MLGFRLDESLFLGLGFRRTRRRRNNIYEHVKCFFLLGFNLNLNFSSVQLIKGIILAFCYVSTYPGLEYHNLVRLLAHDRQL